MVWQVIIHKVTLESFANRLIWLQQESTNEQTGLTARWQNTHGANH